MQFQMLFHVFHFHHINYSFLTSNVATFITLVFFVVGLNFCKNESSLELILKKSCMPKIKLTSDLEVT
jgi:hypothetical protein